MPPTSLNHKAYEAIHHMILHNELSKGSVTSEFHLCQQLGMSRTPIRSALQRLELEGFLQIVPKHGILILDQSAQKAGDLLDVLSSLLLFAITSLRRSNQQQLYNFIMEQERSFQTLIRNHSDYSHETSEAWCGFELGLLVGLIELIQNREVTRLFTQTTGRLYWLTNKRRWKPPCYKNSEACLQRLLNGVPDTKQEVYEILLPYIQLLKKTWE